MSKVLVTGGAGFIGSNLVDALLERGDEVIALDNLTTGRRANIEPALSRGAKLIVEDIRDADLVGGAAREGAARGGVPPRGPDRRACLDGAPAVRRGDQRGRHDQHAGGRAAGRHAALRVRIHRRRDLRRDRRDPDAGGHRDPARGSVRPGEVRGRGLPRPVEPHARPVDRQPALRQRVRPAPGPARRGRRDRDLLRQARDGRPADRVRRRAADARLRVRRGRRPRVHARRRQRRGTARTTSAAARRSPCCSWWRRCASSAPSWGC